jgi:hypothetical protein
VPEGGSLPGFNGPIIIALDNSPIVGADFLAGVNQASYFDFQHCDYLLGSDLGFGKNDFSMGTDFRLT